MMEGVENTMVGYTGGKAEFPTYEAIGDHTEALQVHFNPKIVTYEKIMEKVWESHNPSQKSFGQQYKNAIWYENEE